MRKFTPQDIYLHRPLSGLAGSRDHERLAFKVSRALRKQDRNEGRLHVLAQGDAVEPRALTTPHFNARSPVWSPDGRTLAFLSNRGQRGTQVHLLSMEGGEANALTRTTTRLGTIYGWSRDGRKLLVSVTRECREDGEQETPRQKRAPEVARFLPYKRDGAGIIVGSRVHLYTVDVGDGTLAAITEGDYSVSGATWAPDSRRVAYLRDRGGRERHRTDLWLAEADGANAMLLTDRLASISQLAWSPDGKWLAVIGCEEEGDSFRGVWLLDADGTERPRQLGGGDFEVEPTCGLHWERSGSRLAVVALERGVHRLAVVSVPDGSHTRITSGLRHVVSLASWGERLAFIAASMRQPEEIFSVDWNGNSEQRHTAFNRAWVRRRTRPHVRKRRFQVPDGDGHRETIEAWLLLPDGPGPHPLLVDMHGGPHSTALIDFSAHAYWYPLISEGWAIVAPNAVGSASYGRTFARRLRGRWGELDLPQYDAIIDALRDEGLADDRVACAGKSYGGFLGAWAVGHSDAYRAAIVCAPVANIESHYGTSDTGYYVTPYAMGQDVVQGRGRYQALSPIAHCHGTSVATLILQGENDGRCPRGQAEELFAHLIHCSDAPAELVIYPTSTHSEAESGRPSNRVDYHARVVEWATRWALDAGTREDATRPDT